MGFFYISGTGIDEGLFERMLAATKEFFALPMAEKMKSYIGLSSCHRGYVPVGEEGLYGDKTDLKEAFDTALDLPADDPDHLAGNPMLGPNVWPDLPGFAGAVTDYYQAILGVGRDLLGAFAIALGEDPDTFTRFATKTPSQLRLIYYPHNPEAQDVQGIGAHTDYECFTLLKPTAPGLEVLNGDGEWIDAPPIPGTYVVNVGDLLELWTNGAFVATSHRVRKVKEERYPSRCSSTSTTTPSSDRCPSSNPPAGPSAHPWWPASTCSPRPRRRSPICVPGWNPATSCCLKVRWKPAPSGSRPCSRVSDGPAVR